MFLKNHRRYVKLKALRPIDPLLSSIYQKKKGLREEKLKQEEKYMWAIIDGVKEKVGNFRAEPPGLFRGRGEHPKMGKVKRRITPNDVVINIGKDAPIHECPIPGKS
ncbi:DNA topoisomerase 1 alpha [Trifolium repens]|nr:DNA topoisomerase 1 alpha [Trifolium repens]